MYQVRKRKEDRWKERRDPEMKGKQWERQNQYRLFVVGSPLRKKVWRATAMPGDIYYFIESKILWLLRDIILFIDEIWNWTKRDEKGFLLPALHCRKEAICIFETLKIFYCFWHFSDAILVRHLGEFALFGFFLLVTKCRG